MTPADADVVVVGAGPVGLAVAVELGRRGVATLVVERRERTRDKPPTANHVGVRVMEILRRWGISGTVRQASFDPEHGDDRYWLTRVGGHVVRHVRRPPNGSPTPPSFSPEAELWSPKHDFDPQLEALADTLEAVRFAYGERVVGLDQRADGVVVRTAEGREIEARWVVACDGANSDAREICGIGRAGHAELPVVLQSVDFRSPRLAALLPADGTQFFLLDPAAAIVAIDPVDRFRIHFPALDATPLAPDRAANRIDELVGSPVAAEIRSVLPWRLRQAVADRWRRERVVLAGDAAKQATPYGGLGMNYGVVDAATLGWMLSALVEGWGGDGLLDGYELERRSAAVRFLAYQGLDLSGPEPRTDNRFAPVPVSPEVHDEGPVGRRARAELAAALVADDHAHFDNAGVDVDQRACGSPIVVPDGSPEPGWRADAHRDVVRPGHRFPHRRLPDGRSTLDLFDRGFTVVAGGADPALLADALATRGVPHTVHHVPSGTVEVGLALVRPDGLTAWCGPEAPPDPRAVVDAVRGA